MHTSDSSDATSGSTSNALQPLDILLMFVRYPLRWLVPAILVAVGVAGATTMRRDTWEASQALVVRNEAAGNADGPGKFRRTEDLKAVLETLLEISKSRSVLAAALEKVGPPAERKATGSWPSDQEIADLADAVKLAPPKGGEYGKTEVFYLKVKDNSRERAIHLADALCTELEKHFSELRNQRAASMVSELEQTVQLAAQDVTAATGRVQSLEADVGGDLSELRNLNQSSGGGESNLRRKALELENELRQATLLAVSRQELHQALDKARRSPDQMLALPNGLLEAQPSLKRLKDGLLDAQLRSAALLGTMSPRHPAVKAAQVAQQEISDRLQQELIAAVGGVEIDVRLAKDRVRTLDEQLQAVRDRLARLAGLRVEYSNRINELEQRTKLLSDSERRLVETRASQEAGDITSLLSRLDRPDTGPKPVGPGKTVLLLGGIAGGLVAGVGVLFLTAQPTPGAPRKKAEPRSSEVYSPVVSASTANTANESLLPDTAVGQARELSLKRVLTKFTREKV